MDGELFYLLTGEGVDAVTAEDVDNVVDDDFADRGSVHEDIINSIRIRCGKISFTALKDVLVHI